MAQAKANQPMGMQAKAKANGKILMKETSLYMAYKDGDVCAILFDGVPMTLTEDDGSQEI